MEKTFPKILTVSINAWKDNSGINTLIGILSNWDSNKLAQIYTRSAMPNTKICDIFFQISESKVVKSVFNRKINTGSRVFNQKNSDECLDEQNEKALYKKKNKIPAILLTWAREIVWLFGKWKTNSLDTFIDDFDADVLFFPIYPTIYMGKLQKYVLKRSNKPVVSYIADDNYSYLAISKNPLSLLHRFFLRHYVKFVLTNSDQVFVISPKQKEEYDNLFNLNCKILTKGLDYDGILYEDYKINHPIRMVYTGKLIIGRWKSLSMIADALGKINKNETKVLLDIYTTDSLSDEQNKKLNRNGCTVKGALTQSEVKIVQKEADILVFVESLENKYKNIARLSFSTKITDYLYSGKCIFAIGSSDIAPIDYFFKYDSAITATNENEIFNKLNFLVNNPEKINDYGKKGFECGKIHHDKKLMDRIFYDSVMNILTEKEKRNECK